MAIERTTNQPTDRPTDQPANQPTNHREPRKKKPVLSTSLVDVDGSISLRVVGVEQPQRLVRVHVRRVDAGRVAYRTEAGLHCRPRVVGQVVEVLVEPIFFVREVLLRAGVVTHVRVEPLPYVCMHGRPNE